MSKLSAGALAGIRVLDLGRVLAAPLAGQLLGDLGAEVVKIERPEVGDDARMYGPGWLHDADGRPTNDSSFYLAANRNKRSVTVDFSRPEGQEVVRRLAARSDVLIENFLPGALARAGLDYESLRRLNPRLVYCSVTGYGQSGPYALRPGYDPIFQAESGVMSVTGRADGDPGGGPVRVGFPVVDVMTGHNVAIAVLAALRHRDAVSGEGQHIEVALFDVAVAMQTNQVQGFLMTGEQPGRWGAVSPGGHPAGIYPCQDGDIYLTAGTSRQHVALCAVLRLPQLAEDPRFGGGVSRFEHRAAWDAIAAPVIAAWRRAELFEALAGAGVPCSLVAGYADVFADPYAEARGLTVEVADPRRPDSAYSLVASPIRMSATPAAHDRPPMLGEHTAAVLAEVAGYEEEEIAALREKAVI